MLTLPEHVRFVLDRLNQAGYEAYCVGGCVRDMLRAVLPNDYDVATSALPEQTKAVFDGYETVDTGMKHGTVTVVLDHEPIEITTYRVDGGYSDHRHPDEVAFTPSLEEDLARRDFTVNAIAYHPDIGIVDPFGGQDDLERKVLRAVGDPERRFREDALRILRALRFSSTLGFSIESATGDALFACRDLQTDLAAERVYTEWRKLVCGENVKNVVCHYAEVLAVTVPELSPAIGFDQHNPHHIYDVLTHSAVATASIAPAPHLRFAALFHDLAKPLCYEVGEDGYGHFYGHATRGGELVDTIMERFRADRFTAERTALLVRQHDAPIENEKPVLRRKCNRFGKEATAELIALQRADNLAMSPDYRDRQKHYDALEVTLAEVTAENAYTVSALKVNGNDLLALGLSGKQIGDTLNYLLAEVIADRVANDRDALLALVKKGI